MNQKNISLTNQTAAQSVPFVVLQDSWVQLSPYGDFPHGKGLQRIDRLASDTLTANFHSFSGKLGRRFAGIPFYVGHPDVARFENSYPDRKAYGWVMALESRDDGLYGQIKWSNAGNDLLENAHYKFLSPYWEAAEIGFEKGLKVFRPQTLISVGLTNQPNLPVLPLANSEATEGSAAFQAVPAGIHPPQFCYGGRVLPAPQAEQITPAPLQNTIETLTSELRTQTLLNAQDRARFSQLESQFQTFNERFLNNIVDSAICQGKILPTEREHWRNQLEKDFDTKTAELANAKPVLKTQFTRQFSNSGVSASPDSFERTRKIQNLIEDKMRIHGYGYDRAWEELKAENPALFATLQTPTASP